MNQLVSRAWLAALGLGLGLGGCADRPLQLPESQKDGGAPMDAWVSADFAVAEDLGTSDLAVARFADLAEPALRQLSPLSTSTATSHRPTFRWVGTPDAVVDLCADRACASATATLAGAQNRARPTSAFGRGVVFWRVRAGSVVTPVWELFVGARDAALDNSYGTTLDVNGDGIPDVAVGQGGFAGSSAAFVYLGGVTGAFDNTKVTVLPLDDGFSVASAGDLDGDGFGDFVASSVPLSSAPGNEQGVANVYYGGPGGLTAARSTTLTSNPGDGALGRTLGGVGDVNGDGYGDLLVTSTSDRAHVTYLFFGGPEGVSLSAGRFVTFAISDFNDGLSSAGGDFNGDGYGDFVIGDPDANGNLGRAEVYYGGPSGVSAPTVLAVSSAPSTAVSFQLGWSVAAADLDGDGYPDVIVGPPALNDTYVFAGGPNGVSTQPTRTLMLPNPPGVLALAGDIDGDGRDDLLFAGVNASNTQLFLSGPATVRNLNAATLYGLAASGGEKTRLLVGADGHVLMFDPAAPDGGAVVLTPPDGGTAAFGYAIGGVR